MKKTKKLLFALIPAIVTTPALTLLASCQAENEDDPIKDEHLIYHLDFAKENNLGWNSKKGIENARLNGKANVVGKWHGHNYVEFDDKIDDYFELPTSLLANREDITLSFWTKMKPTGEATLFSYELKNGFTLSLSLVGDNAQWNAFDIKYKETPTGPIYHPITPDADPNAKGLAPKVGCVQSTINTWQLVTFVINSSKIALYQNGRQIAEIMGDYSFKFHSVERFVLGKDLTDEQKSKTFASSFSDIRIYDKSLTPRQVSKNYNVTYKDFLTTDFEFDDGVIDSVRGLRGVLGGGATLKTGQDRKYLDLSPESNVEGKAKSWLDLPGETFFGHNQLTISANLNVRQARSYSRLFSAGSHSVSSNGMTVDRYFDIYAGFRQEDAHKFKLESVENYDTGVLPDYKRQYIMDDNSTYQTNTWMNVTYTIEDNVGIMYINGYPTTINDNFIYNNGILWDIYLNGEANNNFKCVIGRTYGFDNNSLDAMIDNFKIYSVALQPNEVLESLGNEMIENDLDAVEQALMNFTLSRRSSSKINLQTFNNQGVKITCIPLTKDIVDASGSIYPFDNDFKDCAFKITAERGGASKTISRTFSLKRIPKPTLFADNVSLEDATYDDDSQFAHAMEYNADDMFLYDKDRFLVNYQKIAGITPKYENGYGGWIRKNCGGEGQFETFYIGTLARLTQSMPDYEYDNETPFERCKYMLDKIKVCQDTFARNNPEEAGYLGAFPTECFDALINGQSGGQAPGTECNIWVPFYMYHKNLMMCYDVYKYITDSNQNKVAELKDEAYQMLKKACLWLCNKIEGLTQRQRCNVLNIEYGGIGEALYLTYDLVRKNEPDDIESAHRIFSAARFFEETDLLQSMYDNKNMLTGRHVNTTIPKFLASCAAYQVTGDNFYLQAAENFFDIMDQQMTYADGGSSIDEHYENEGVVSQSYWSNETCCCYNMLRLADYLYKFTGKAKYAHYFEKVFYNHIMGSMNTVDVDDQVNAGKAYSTPTAFGYHKVFSNQRAKEDAEGGDDAAFWCCCCTGQETFAKLTYGNFYLNSKKELFVNMYNPISYANNNLDVTIDGDVISNKSLSEVTLTINSASADQIIHLIKPWWCLENVSFKIADTPVELTDEGEYYALKVGQDIQVGQTLTISLRKSYKFIAQHGHETAVHEGKTYYSNAVYFGPAMLVANLEQLGTKNELFVYNQHQPTKYSGEIKQYNSVDGSMDDLTDYFSAGDDDYNHVLTLDSTATIKFTPWMKLGYEYYSMYMFYCFL